MSPSRWSAFAAFVLFALGGIAHGIDLIASGLETGRASDLAPNLMTLAGPVAWIGAAAFLVGAIAQARMSWGASPGDRP